MSIHFLSPVYPDITPHPHEKLGFLKNAAHLFNFGQKSYRISYLRDSQTIEVTKIKGHQASWIAAAIRIVLLCTVFIPLIAAAAALVYFSANTFKVVPPLPPLNETEKRLFKQLEVEGLIDIRASTSAERTALKEAMIHQINNGEKKISDLSLHSPEEVIEFFGDSAGKVTQLDFSLQNGRFIDLDFLQRFPNLTSFCYHTGGLDLVGEPELRDIQGLKHCPNLINLELVDCGSIDSLEVLKHCPELTHFRIDDLQNFDFTLLQHFIKLRDLKIFGFTMMNNLPSEIVI